MHADKWRFALVLIFNVVNGLGQLLAQTATYTLMQGDEFKTQPGINQYLFPNNPIDDQIAAALFTDKIYGLSDPNNWNRWQDFNPGADPQKQALLSMEFKTFFGLTQAQISEMIPNWQKIYKSNEAEFLSTLIGSAEFNDYQRVGYWQWSQGFITQQMGQPSVTKISNAVSGFPEISYWRDEFLCKQISDANKAELCSVQFSDPKSFNNFEALFNMSQGEANKWADPKVSSLFNVQTLKSVLDAGSRSVDITTEKSKDVAFKDAIAPAQSQWIRLSNDLGFCSSMDPAKCDSKQVYMLYLWIDTLYQQTF